MWFFATDLRVIRGVIFGLYEELHCALSFKINFFQARRAKLKIKTRRRVKLKYQYKTHRKHRRLNLMYNTMIDANVRKSQGNDGNESRLMQ